MNPAELREHCLSFNGAEETFPFGPNTSVFNRPGEAGRSLWSRREKSPLVGDSPKPLLAAVHEPDPRPGNEVLDRARDEHFARGGEACDARRDVDRDPADVPIHQLDLAGVEADPVLEAQGAGGLCDRVSTADRPCRAVKGGEKAVARSLDLVPAEACERAPHRRVMR